MRKAILSLEEFEGDGGEIEAITVTPNLVTTIDAHIDGPEEEISAIDSRMRDLEQDEEDVREASEIAGTLDTMAEDIRATVPEGGMGEAEMRRLSVAVEHFYNRVKLPVRYRSTTRVSAESYSTRERRVTSTMEAYEEVKQNAMIIGKKILEAIKKILISAGEIFTRMTSATEQLRRRAKKLGQLANSLRGKSPEDAKEIKLAKSGGILTIKGKFPQGDALFKAYEDHVKCDAISNDYFAAWNRVYNKIAEANASGEISGETINLLQLEIAKVTGQRTTQYNDTIRNSAKLVFGDQELVIEYEKDNFSTMTARVTGVNTEDFEETVVKPMRTELCYKLSDAVDKHLNKYQNTPSIIKQLISHFEDTVVKGIRKMVDTGGVDENGNPKRSGSAAVIDLYRAARTATLIAGLAVRKYDIAVSKAVLDVVAQQLAAYGKPELKMSSSRDLVPA